MPATLLTEADFSWLGRALLAEAVQANRVTTSIRNRVVNKIYYAGDTTQNPGWRSIEIWAYGRNKRGRDVIRAWQREGKSDTPNGNGIDPLRNKPGWRMFRLDRISSFQNATQRFAVDGATMAERKYNPMDRDMSTVYYAVDSTGPGKQPGARTTPISTTPSPEDDAPQTPGNPNPTNPEPPKPAPESRIKV